MIRDFRGKRPQLGANAWVAASAAVIGDVVLGDRASIWYGAVVRGDVEKIRIGSDSNIQDNSVIHVDSGGWPTIVGDGVTVGHRVVLHGCTVKDGALIGIGATVLNGAEIGEGALIGAGSLVTPGTKIPPGVLAIGAPCKVKRPLTDDEKRHLRESAEHYVELAREHA
ncbi:MAG TPA: gamma carbonic anhydrase family protein [Myxococcales bacterium]|nr:gamma carbonic anhydrase family protein [Myxococcales bacterium]